METTNVRKTILIVMVLCLTLAWVYPAKSFSITTKEKRAKALELLDKYAETQNKQRSYTCKWKVISSMNAKLSEPPYKALSGKSRTIKMIESRYDGNRYAERIHKWGNIRSSKIFIPKNRGPYNSILWDGRMYFSYVATVDKPGRLGIYKHIEDLPNKNTRSDHKIKSRFGPCSGLINIYGSEYLNLRKIPSLSVREKTEKIKGIDCYVVEAEDKNAKYTLWIDPEHGHNTAQWQLEYPNLNLRFSLENVRFRNIDNVWIIEKGIVNRLQHFRNGDFTSETRQCELIEIVLNPDHDALGSFGTDDIHNSSSVRIMGIGDILYTWQDGKVVDNYGHEVDIETLKPPSFESKVLQEN